MLIAGERFKVEAFTERFKMAVVSNNPDRWVPLMYPQWVTASREGVKVVEVIEGDDLAELDLENTEGEWIFTEELTAEDVQETLAAMRAEGGGSLTWEDISSADDDDEGWYPG